METEDKGVLGRLVETNEDRIAEELTRPRVEQYVDDFGAWVAWHKAKDRGLEFSPHFGIGWN